jgi:hypothetical protein
MNKILLPIVVIAALGLVGCQTESPDLKELNQHFTYKGKPVQPRAIENLMTWISDKHPGPVAVDMAGTDDSNRYYGEVEQIGGGIGFHRPATGEELFDGGLFFYRHIGRLTNGIHVLKTVDNGGGTGYFESILLVKFTTQEAYGHNGLWSKRVIMQQVGEFQIGDRVNAQVKIHGNTVTWTTEGGSAEEIRFQ